MISFNYKQTDIANSTHTIIVYRPRDYRTLLTGCSLTLPLPRPHLPPSACLGWVERSSGPQTARPSLGQAGWRPHRRVSVYHRITSHSETEALQSDLNRLATWSATWHLKLNPAKCHTTTFSLRKLPIPATYTLDGTALQRRTETRDLGVILDSKLTFAAHIDTTIAKANRMLGLLIRSMQASRRHSRAPIDHKVMLCTFYAHVRSIIEFGCVVWAGAAVSHLKRLERVQHKFLMWLASCSDKRSDNLDYLVLLSHFKVRSIKSRFVQHDLMFLFHVHHARLDSTVLLGAFGLRVCVCVCVYVCVWVMWNVNKTTRTRKKAPSV